MDETHFAEIARTPEHSRRKQKESNGTHGPEKVVERVQVGCLVDNRGNEEHAVGENEPNHIGEELFCFCSGSQSLRGIAHRAPFTPYFQESQMPTVVEDQVKGAQCGASSVHRDRDLLMSKVTKLTQTKISRRYESNSQLQ